MVSPCRQAPRPLMNTLLLPVAMACALQCGMLRSPCLAAAGIFSLHEFPESILPLIDLSVLLRGVWRRRDLGLEFYHMIDVLGYVLELIKLPQLPIDPDHESVRHLSCYDLPGSRSYTSGSFDPAVPDVFACFCYHHPVTVI